MSETARAARGVTAERAFSEGLDLLLAGLTASRPSGARSV